MGCQRIDMLRNPASSLKVAYRAGSDFKKLLGKALVYGFRIYNPGIARFLSVDPLTREYSHYTPYQFSGNKPIRFIDLDGKEEADYEVAVEVAKIVQSTALDFADGMYNTAISVNNGWRSKEYQANFIRTLLVEKHGQSYLDAFKVSDEDLLKNFEVKYTFFDNENKGYYLDGRDGFFGEGLEALSNGLKISSIIGTQSNGLFFAKTPGRIKNDIAKLVDDFSATFKGKFESVQKHGSRRIGNAGKEPDMAQKSLERSLQVSNNSTRRVSANFETGEFTVFDEHLPNIFHGHVRNWGELSQTMQSVLRKSGQVNQKGKILDPSKVK